MSFNHSDLSNDFSPGFGFDCMIKSILHSPFVAKSACLVQTQAQNSTPAAMRHIEGMTIEFNGIDGILVAVRFQASNFRE